MNVRKQNLMQRDTRQLTRDEKVAIFGDGVWCDEDDWVEFDHMGLKCLVIRRYAILEHEFDIEAFGGHFCGYVALPKGHKLEERERGENEFFDVHGGVTFSGNVHDVHYIGFDCAHLYDIIPSDKKPLSDDFLKNKFDSYKNLSFCIRETKKLAEQIARWTMKQNGNLS